MMYTGDDEFLDQAAEVAKNVDEFLETSDVRVVTVRPGHVRRFGKALRVEEGNRASEPYAVDDKSVRDDDTRARAYAQVWSHYECAYNATQHRQMIRVGLDYIGELIEAIMGREVSWDPDEKPFARLVWEATQERARLLSNVERFSDSISSQQRLIAEQSRDAAHGKKAFDALMLLGVRLGINPVPMDPQAFCDSVVAAFDAASQKGTTSDGQ